MTLTGYILIPLSIVLIFAPWRFSVYAFILFAMMSDAAIVNIGAFPLSPAVYYGMLLMTRYIAERCLRMSSPEPAVLSAICPILALFFANIFILFVAIVFFYGKIEVVTGEMGFNYYLAQPFRMVRENFTQVVYLLYHVILVLVFADIVAKLPGRSAAKIVDTAILVALFFSAGVVIWEMAWFYAGIWFPADFFHSDTHSDAWGQISFGGTVLRASGPFSEPSGVGFTFGGFVLYAWRRYRTAFGSTFVSVGALLACIISLALSTATTAYAAMALFAAVAGVDTLTGFGRKEARAANAPRWPGYVLMLGGIVAAILFLKVNWHYVVEIFNTATVEKSQSSSFRERSMVDLMGIHILIDTYGLGLGLGSHKPNSAVITLLSNVGLPGFLLAIYFFVKRLVPLQRRLRQQLPEFSAVNAALRVLLLGWLFGHAFSNPNINHVGVWVLSALLIGLDCVIARLAREPSWGAISDLRARLQDARVIAALPALEQAIRGARLSARR